MSYEFFFKFNKMILLNLINELVFTAKTRKRTIPVYENAADRKKAADNIILNHTAWAAAVGVVPFVNVDMFVISALQLDMLRKLADVYAVDFEQNKGRATIVSLDLTLAPVLTDAENAERLRALRDALTLS